MYEMIEETSILLYNLIPNERLENEVRSQSQFDIGQSMYFGLLAFPLSLSDQLKCQIFLYFWNLAYS